MRRPRSQVCDRTPSIATSSDCCFLQERSPMAVKDSAARKGKSIADTKKAARGGAAAVANGNGNGKSRNGADATVSAAPRAPRLAADGSALVGLDRRELFDALT